MTITQSQVRFGSLVFYIPLLIFKWPYLKIKIKKVTLAPFFIGSCVN